MTLSKSAVAVNEEFRLDLSNIPQFIEQGDPDLELRFVFSAPRLPSKQELVLSAHREVLSGASPIFKRWIGNRKDRVRSGEPALVREIKNDDRDCLGFREFLIFIYTKKLAPLNLVPIFGYALQFGVGLKVDDFKTALCCRNMLRLLEKFPAEEQDIHPRYLSLRGFILEKIESRPLEILNSTYFPFMKATTLEEVMGRLLGKITEAALLNVLLGWAKFECDRQGMPRNIQNAMKVLPSPLIGQCRLNRIDVEDELGEMMMGEVEVDETNNGNGPKTPPGSPPASKRPIVSAGTSAPRPPKKKLKDEDIKINVLVVSTEEETSYRVSPTLRVSDLHYGIQGQTGIPADQFRLLFDGIILERYHTLTHYNIKDGDEIEQYDVQRGC